MSQNFSKPAALMLLSILFIVIIIFSIPLFAGLPIITATDSANLVSGQSTLSASIPWFMLLVMTGIIVLAVKLSGANV